MKNPSEGGIFRTTKFASLLLSLLPSLQPSLPFLLPYDLNSLYE